jgi:hypothetical protein
MKLPMHYYSWTTVIGAAIAAVSLFMIVILFLMSLIFGDSDNYSGLFTFIILPSIMFIGLSIMLFGILIRIRSSKKQQFNREVRFPIVDFNDPRQRFIVVLFAMGVSVFIVLSALGSYQAFHYTESNEFCGTLCHKVMEPEYVAYQGSSHARVQCVECHVGSGAGWYIKSKLSGLYQVYSVLVGAYPTPIPTPLHNLRPAQETCEKCHWPEKFYDRKYVLHKHYLADEENTEWDIGLVMKTGPAYRALGLIEGIHWHINKDVVIEYASTNPKRDTIVWVRYSNLKTGEQFVYRNDEIPVTEDELAKLEFRKMDCLDCHNRPSHHYKSPAQYFDAAMTAGNISKLLPDIKIVAMEILRNEFPSRDSAFKYIEKQVLEYYELLYPEIIEDNRDMLENAIRAIQEGYANNTFPTMKVSWNVYPNYMGHIVNNGCYRCHNDSFKSKENRVISRECNLCHLIKEQGKPGEMEFATGQEYLEFVHPVDIKDKWKKVFCAECHVELY